MSKLKTGNGDATHKGGDIDQYEVEVDGGGEDERASAKLSYGEPFKDPPALVVSSASGTAGWSARGSSQATITSDEDEVVFVLAIGDR